MNIGKLISSATNLLNLVPKSDTQISTTGYDNKVSETTVNGWLNNLFNDFQQDKTVQGKTAKRLQQEEISPVISADVKTNGNPSDIKVDQALTKLFTNGKEGFVAGASSARAKNLKTGDSHYQLGDGKLHSIHVYGDRTGNKTVGLFIPKEFSQIKFVGGSEGTIEATNPKTGEVLQINHVSVKSAAELKRNMKTTNDAGSVYVGNIAGKGGSGSGYKHTHITLYVSKNARDKGLEYKNPFRNNPKQDDGTRRDIDGEVSNLIGNFRNLIKDN